MRFRRVLAYLGIVTLILFAWYMAIPLLIPDLIWGEQTTLQMPGDELHFRFCVTEAVDLVPQVRVSSRDPLPTSVIDLVPSPTSGLNFGLYRVTREPYGEVQIDALGPANLRFFYWRARKMKATLAALSDAIAEKCIRIDATPLQPAR